MTKSLGLPLLAAALLSGCNQMPRHERPATPVATTYPDVTNAATHITETGWRSFFQDLRLQSLIAAALDNNRDLRIAALRIAEARAQYQIQLADLLPSLNGNASDSRARTPGDLTLSGKPVTGGRADISIGMTAFELDFFGRVRSLNAAALAQYLATEEAQRAARISLIAEVAKAYLTERSLHEQQELAKKTLEARATTVQFSQQRLDVGASSALDLRLAESQWHAARVALATLARQRSQASNALTLLVGKPPGDLPPAQGLSAQVIETNLPAGAPSDLLTQRPDIRAAEQKLIAANANIGAARAAFFPRIALTANVGTASHALSGLFDTGSGSWLFVPQLTLPIFDRGRNQNNLDVAETRKHIAIADYEKTIQTAFREVADALTARDFLDQQVAAQQALRETQSERLRLSDLRFQNGVANSLELLDAQRDLFAAEQALVQARLLRLTNAVDLYRALGGGLGTE